MQNFKSGGSVEVGDLVLIRDENMGSRLQWPLARVVKLYPGRDGRVRSVDVKTTKSIVCRPIQKLHKLEVSKIPTVSLPHVNSNLSSPVEINDDGTQTPIPNRTSNISIAKENYRTRSGRLSRAPDRLGF